MNTYTHGMLAVNISVTNVRPGTRAWCVIVVMVQPRWGRGVQGHLQLHKHPQSPPPPPGVVTLVLYEPRVAASVTGSSFNVPTR